MFIEYLYFIFFAHEYCSLLSSHCFAFTFHTKIRLTLIFPTNTFRCTTRSFRVSVVSPNNCLFISLSLSICSDKALLFLLFLHNC